VYGEAWCNGAPGIGLARLGMLDVLDTPPMRADIAAAIHATKTIPRSETDHLCCGNLGRIEFLHTAGLRLSRADLVTEAQDRLSEIVVGARQRNSYGYGRMPAFIPGLFQGAAGIGYELLRIARADLVPSVLLWESGCCKRETDLKNCAY
jgi:lantibiotic modifying enzyme